MEVESKKEKPRLSQYKPVEMDSEEKLGDFCLVCFSKVDRSKLPKQRSLLSSNLNVIFLLRKLLEVPSELLIGNFKKCGSPVYWISLCEKCSQLTGQAMEHHLQILNLVNQLRSILKLFTDKMRESSVLLDEALSFYQDDKNDKMKSMQDKRLDILKRTREFVTNYEYNIALVSPFIEGDKLARERAQMEDSSSLDHFEVEYSAKGDGDWSGWGGDWQAEEEDEGTGAGDKLAREVYGKKESSSSAEEDSEKGGSVVQLGDDGEGGPSPQVDLKVEEDEGPNSLEEDGDDMDWNWEEENEASEAEDSEEEGSAVQSAESGDDGEGGLGEQEEADDKMEEEIEAPFQDKLSSAELERVRVDGKWKCRFCEKLFKSKDNWRNHEDGKHPAVPGQFKCQICGKGINSKYYLYEHLRKTHKINAAGNPIELDPRKKEELDKKKGQQQKRAAHVEVDGKWKCRHCEKTFWSKSAVHLHESSKHAQNVAGNLDFECEICGKRLSGKSYLLSHRRQVHKLDRDGNRIEKQVVKIKKKEGNKSVETERKRKRGRISGSSSLHVQVNGKWKCRQCDKEFTNRNSVYPHVREQHPAVEGQFKCDICGMAKNSRFGLLIHRRYKHKVNMAGDPITIKLYKKVDKRIKIKKEKKEKRRVKPKDPSTCHLCGKEFGWMHELNKHIRYVHEKKYDVSCGICGMGVYNKYALDVHLLTTHKDDPATLKLVEEGTKLWKCGVVGCRATYLKETRLEEHTRKMHGDGKEQNAQKRFTCSFCGKTFWYWHTLKVHERSHKSETEKPYSCELCGANFKFKSSIRRHKLKFHPVKNE